MDEGKVVFLNIYVYYLNAWILYFLNMHTIPELHLLCKVETDNKGCISYILNCLFMHYEEQVKIKIFTF